MPNEIHGVIGGIVIAFLGYFFNKKFDKDKREHEKGSKELVDFSVIAKIYREGMEEQRIEIAGLRADFKACSEQLKQFLDR